MNKKIFVILILLILFGVGIFVVVRNNTGPLKELPAPAPEGFIQDRRTDEYKPVIAPKSVEVPLQADGLPDEDLVLVKPENGSSVVVRIKNNESSPFRFRLVHTPEGEWLDDPIRTIDAGGEYPIVVELVGQYTLQNADNTDQIFTITLEKD